MLTVSEKTPIGLITYNTAHLKTEQVVKNIALKYKNIKMYALPFVKRKKRNVLFQHRPNQSLALETAVLAKKYGIEFIKCRADTEITNECSFYLILGAGILSKDCVSGKKIINAHPGIIPACRGLDSFKWAVYNNLPLGNTLHFIDEKVDAGEIIAVVSTKVYKNDTFESLSKRHYENEIAMLSSFDYYLKNPVNNYKNILSREATRRMGFETEKQMIKNFKRYVEKWGE